MSEQPCPLGSCCTDGPRNRIWFTVNIEFADTKTLLDNHVKVSHQGTGNSLALTQLKAKKIKRPHLKVKDGQIDKEAWEFILQHWATYISLAKVTLSTKQHLKGCLGDKVTLVLFSRLVQAGCDLLTEATLRDIVKE